MDRLQLSRLAVLAAVADHQSFRGAARELQIAPSAVSHAVSALEESLGVRLLARTTRSVRPTDEGLRLLERLRPALGGIEAALKGLQEGRDKPAGRLRVTMPRLAAEHIVAPRAGAFCALYPDIELELVCNDRFEDIVSAGYDAGMRLGESLESDMIAVKATAPLRGAVVATPSYFERFEPPLHPRDLIRHRCIRRRFSSGVIYRWEFEKDGQPTTVSVDGPLIMGDDRLVLAAALDGAGLAYLFDARLDNALEDGRLVRVLEDWCPPFDGFYIYYPSRRQMRPALRAFIDFFRFSGTGDPPSAMTAGK